MAMLCFAFWASFSRLGEPTLKVTTWPLIWLTSAILILVHPIPIMAKSPRYWFIKTFLKLFLSGMRPVEVSFILSTSFYWEFSHLDYSSPISGWGEAGPLYFLLFFFDLTMNSDQLSSLIFTISNTPLFVCVYLDKFSDNWQKCRNNSSRMWPISFALASIPFIIRLVQSFKRYVDSKLVTHLINVRSLFFCWALLSNLES